MYKYMSTEVAALFASSLKVRFTQPSDLNDPFELRPLVDFKATAEEMRDLVDAKLAEMFATVDRILSIMEKQQITDPNYPKMLVPLHIFRKMIVSDPALEKKFVAEMQRHRAEVTEDILKTVEWETVWENVQQTFGQSIGIFSLTEDPAHTLMWSHYASQHFGAVVEFDENDPWFNQRITPSDEIRHLVQVTYVQNPHPRTWKQLNGTDVLYTKNFEWAYEREWRIIRPLTDGTEVGPGKVCFDIPARIVRSIIFGCRTTPTVEKQIRAFVVANQDLKHVQLKRAKLAGDKIDLVDAT